jgi:putative SOS response-associated peptidase YedK
MIRAMCNLYSMTTTHQAMRQLFRLESGCNQLRLPGIFPDYQAPIVRRSAAGERELVAARWGMPTPPALLKGPIDRGVTSIRNLHSSYWLRWLKPEFRCLVPATSFSEPTDARDPVTGQKIWTWFALDESRPLFAFAGMWCTWTGARGTQRNPAIGEHTLYGFLTTAPNEVVKPVNEKAMPAILTTAEECDAWLAAEPHDAFKLWRPLPAEMLKVVAAGKREDTPPVNSYTGVDLDDITRGIMTAALTLQALIA